MKIFKYLILPSNVKQKIMMPMNAEVLSFQMQNQQLYIWALVDPDNEMEGRLFCVFGTGHEIVLDGEEKYIGTAQMMGGSLVWHLFEERTSFEEWYRKKYGKNKNKSIDNIKTQK